MKLRLGLRYDLRAPSEPERLYAGILEHAAHADALGVDALWVSERPFAADAALPAALPVCAALAVRTRRARIGTAVLPLPLYHPLRLAEDAATLDGLSGGRLDLGLGLGGHPEAFDGFGVPMSARPSLFEESLRVLRLAFEDAPVRFEGRHHRIEGTAVEPKPAQRPGPPLWIGANADTMVRLAARIGDGLVTGVAGAAARFLDAWEEEGRDAAIARIALEVPGAADPDPERAREALAEAVGTLGGRSGELCLVVPAFDALRGPGPGLGLAREALERLLGDVFGPLRADRSDSRGSGGSPIHSPVPRGPGGGSN